MIKLHEIREGSIVTVHGGFGTESARQGRVDAVEEDIKNGRAGIEYTEADTGKQRWAYINQVQQVVEY